MIHIGFCNHFIHRYSFTKVTKPILKSGDFNTCLICSIETKKKERERVNNKTKEKVHVSDDHYHRLHSTFNYLSKQEEKKRKKEKIRVLLLYVGHDNEL
jgi:hypothetical protein